MKSTKKALVLYYNRRHNPVIISRLRALGVSDVHVVLVNLGERSDSENIKKEAVGAGANAVHMIDGRLEFADNYLSTLIKANAVYQRKYFLSAAIARAMLSHKVAIVAKDLNIDRVIHGFRGNDQIRMNMGFQFHGIKYSAALADLHITDEEILEYSKKYGIPDDFGTCNPYSVSENIWGKSIECGPLEDLCIPASSATYDLVSPLNKIANKFEDVEIEFFAGIPTKLNNQESSLFQIILNLNQIAGRNGIGRMDMIEDGYVGLKTRAIYEHPAAFCIIEAHRELESLIFNRHERVLKAELDHKVSEFVYAGLWHDRTMTHLQATINCMNQPLTGKIKMRLAFGNIEILSRESKCSIYNPEFAVYNFGHKFSAGDADGYSKVFNLHSTQR